MLLIWRSRHRDNNISTGLLNNRYSTRKRIEINSSIWFIKSLIFEDGLSISGKIENINPVKIGGSSSIVK
jgi:hypothetical protein